MNETTDTTDTTQVANAVTDAWKGATAETRAEFIKQAGGVATFVDSASPEDRAEFIRFASNTHLLVR
jgi:hypothetical protein